ncbi:MAG TPA: TrbI/VirB10 family protein [Allosphingosinicella sp.]|nr:TrbI/VirB10 family protein [Allosphingosinicella sp.]
MIVAETVTKSPRTGDIVPLRHGGHNLPLASDPRADLDDGAMLQASRLAYPAVAARSSRKEGLSLAAGGATAILLGAVTLWSMSGSREANRTPAAAPVQAQPATNPALQPVGDFQPGGTEAAATPGGSLIFSAPPPPRVFQGGQVQAAPITGGSAPSSTLAERFRSPSLILDESGPVTTSDGSAPAAGNAPVAFASAPQAAAGGGDDFAARADASARDTATATRMADPGHTVAQGTLIPAVLETAINTDLPGYVRAVVSEDVMSFDGRRVLIPRSSRLIGQYRSGLAAGQRRAYVLWSRLIRPDGASVAIASPATDESGRTGVTGQVDSHFFQRFGSALLLSVLGAASNVGTGGASTVMTGGTSAAAVATQQNGSIPPTVRVRQGHPIRVFTARDLNFAGVTEIAAR